jgi:hypothetical protein
LRETTNISAIEIFHFPFPTSYVLRRSLSDFDLWSYNHTTIRPHFCGLWFTVQNFWTKFICNFEPPTFQLQMAHTSVRSINENLKVRSSRACVCLVSNLISFGFEIV